MKKMDLKKDFSQGTIIVAANVRGVLTQRLKNFFNFCPELKKQYLFHCKKDRNYEDRLGDVISINKDGKNFVLFLCQISSSNHVFESDFRSLKKCIKVFSEKKHENPVFFESGFGFKDTQDGFKYEYNYYIRTSIEQSIEVVFSEKGAYDYTTPYENVKGRTHFKIFS